MADLGFPMIISSYALFEHCKKQYPNKNVVADMHPRHEEFYYWNRKNELRMIRNKTEVWIGIPWPTIRRRR